MNFNDIKKRIYKASETKAFWSNVSLFLLILAYVVIEGFETSTWFFAAVLLTFSVSGLVYVISYNVIDKKKPDLTALKIILLISLISLLLYYYEQINLLKFSYIFGFIFGFGIMVIYGIAATFDKFRK